MLRNTLHTNRFRPDTQPLPVWMGARMVNPRRQGVVAALDEAVARESAAKVLVCAPAGTGKTTLLGSWVAERDAPDRAPRTAWLTLDPADNDPTNLQRRVRDTLAGIDSRVGPAVLVLDDAHVVTDAGALAQLTAIVESVLAHVTVVVAARRAPGLPWSKYAAEGSLTFVGCEELALDRDAVAAVFGAHHCALPADSLDAVYELTGGWAGAVCSVAQLVRASGNVGGDITALLTRPHQISDYVVGETVAGLPSELALFVRATSVVDRFTHGLLEDLVGENADLHLYACEARGIPVRREVVDGELVYSWHPLLRRHMRAVLREEDPVGTARLHVTAAHSLAEAGHTLEAFSHLAGISDEQIVEEFVLRWGAAAVFDGIGDPALALLGARNGRLPCARLLRSLVALEANDPNAARAHLHSAVSVSGEREMSAAARSLAAALEIEADVIGGAPISESTVQALESCRSTGNTDLDCYVLVQRAAAAMLSGRLAQSERLLGNALALAGLGGHPRLVLRCLARLSIVAAVKGELATMGARAEHAVDYAVEHGLIDRIDAAQCAAVVCMCVYHRGEQLSDDSSLHALMSNRAVHVRPDGTTDPVTGNHSQVAFAIVRARCLPHATNEAVDAVGRQMLAVLRRGPQSGFTSNYVSTSAAILLDAGRTVLADDVVHAATEIFGHNPDVQVARALIELDSGATAAAERLLRSVLESEQGQSRILTVQAWVLVAVAGARSRRGTEAVDSIRRALKLAETDLIVRPFMNFAGDVAELLPAIRPGEGITQQFLDHVRAKLAEASAGRNPGLTPAEKQFLAQLRTGETLKEIAKRMHLSVNTVRTHARNVYRKLDASGRDQAVEVAIRRGLL